MAIFAVGFALTATSVWATKRIDDATEQRLLERQTKQAAAVLSRAIVVNQQPLANALTVQPAEGVDPALFRKSMSDAVDVEKTCVSASIWQRKSGRLVRLAALGVEPAMAAESPTTQEFLESSFTKNTFTTTSVSKGGERRIAYALADPGTGRVVHAERAIPPDGRSPSDSNSAFKDIDYAIYLGAEVEPAALATTGVDPNSLPFTGPTATERVPFGATVLTLVTTPRNHLGASLSEQLPFILLIAGGFLTVVAVVVSRLLVRRRKKAEESAAFAVSLSERLQRALLPLAIPDIAQLEVAVEYVAGARGVEIGGDWYSIIALDPDHFAFVVGDASGKGIDAVAVMARARFTLRAYLLRGDSPDVALSMAARQFDVSEDGHIVTTIVGVGNWRTGEMTIANAGHCRPVLLNEDGARFVELATGPPLGAGLVTYPSTSITMAPGDVLFCYTDGLIERRNEGIDTGMNRLSATLAPAAGDTVADLVRHSVRSLRSEQAEDDIAVLAFRWAGKP